MKDRYLIAIPFNGFLLFLRSNRKVSGYEVDCSNPLQRVSLISTEDTENYKEVTGCSNPLQRVSLISTRPFEPDSHPRCDVVIPFNGFLSFLRIRRKIKQHYGYVAIPFNGFLSFLRTYSGIL